jgi:hypothetical protein
MVKKTFLLNGISTGLREAIVAVPMSATYQEYYSLLHSVSQNQEALQRYHKWAPMDRTKRGYRQNTEDTMEWEPTSVVNVVTTQNGPRAKWATEQELKKRREDDNCLRYSKTDHFIREYRLRPTQRPEVERPEHRKTIRVAKVAQKETEIVEEVTSEEESEMSENE